MDQKPTRRMTDMAPRRMDGFGRAAVPAGRDPRVTPRSQAQPATPAPRNMPQADPRTAQPARRPERPQAYQAASRQPQAGAMRPQPQRQLAPAAGPAQAQPAPRQAKRSGGGWKVALQFLIGLFVIIGVAGAIVWLYITYYTQ